MNEFASTFNKLRLKNQYRDKGLRQKEAQRLYGNLPSINSKLAPLPWHNPRAKSTPSAPPLALKIPQKQTYPLISSCLFGLSFLTKDKKKKKKMPSFLIG